MAGKQDRVGIVMGEKWHAARESHCGLAGWRGCSSGQASGDKRAQPGVPGNAMGGKSASVCEGLWIVPSKGGFGPHMGGQMKGNMNRVVSHKDLYQNKGEETK